MSIRKTLLRLSTTVIVLAVAVASLTLWFAVRELFLVQRGMLLFNDAGRLALMVRRIPPGSTHPFQLDLRPELLSVGFDKPDDGGFFQVWTSDGHTIARSGSLNHQDLPWPPSTLAPAPTGVRTVDTLPVKTDDEGQAIDFNSIVLPDGTSGTLCWLVFSPQRGPLPPGPADDELSVVIAVARPDAPLNAMLVLAAAIVTGAGICTVLLSRVAIGLIVRRGLRPLTTLSTRVGAIDLSGPRADHAQRLPEAGLSDETQPIAAAINALVDRAERVLERERRFTDGVTHELRTPLTEIRTTAEVSVHADVATMRESLVSIARVTAATGSLLDTLLRLSRRSMARDQHLLEPVRLDDLITRSLQTHALMIDERRLRVDIDVPASAKPISDPSALAIVLDNLIANAAEYTKPGGSISIALTRHAAMWTLTIANGPTAMTEVDVPMVFEPFWRKDRARSDGRHSGLGLCVERSLLNGLESRVDATLKNDRFAVLVTMPDDPRDCTQN
jgi:signal transduction histidine kinase